MRVGLALALALSLTACAKREHAVNPANPLWLHRPGWSLSLTFRNPLSADPWSSKAGIEKSVPAIDATHGRIFVGTTDRGLYAVRAGDGSVIWRFQTAGAVQSEPLYDPQRDLVYFGSDDDGLYAVRASDGKLMWRYRTGAEVQRRPVLVTREGGRGILVFDNAADAVFAVDATTGETKWKHVRNPALGLEISGHAGVAYANERVYCAFSTGRIVAYDLETGAERWPEVDLTAVGGPSEGEQQYFDVDTTPVVVGDRVYVANVATGIFALDATAGTQMWRRPEAEGVSWLTHWSEPAHTDAASGAEIPERSLLIAGSGTTGLWALDPKSGEVRWRREGPRGTVGHPVQIAGAILVTSSKLGMFLFDPQQGRPIDGIDPGSGFAAGAAAWGNKAFVLTNRGVLLGFEVVPPAREPTTARTW
ncbi:MAG: PQQ-like beta-propeller repeat protein [Deltaproteobacteria bacterium]|nr:PQQ-like beta-propeller repeat protein [Deltaproteobacteria bacterium]